MKELYKPTYRATTIATPNLGGDIGAFGKVIGDLTAENLKRNAMLDAAEERKAREAEDLRRFELQQARYKMEDDRYNRKEQMILDKENKASGGEQALAMTNEIARNAALGTSFGKSLYDKAVEARGSAFDTSKPEDAAQLRQIADIALTATPRDELLKVAAPSFAAYGINPKELLGQMETMDAGKDFDALASSRNALLDKDYSQQLSRVSALRNTNVVKGANGEDIYLPNSGADSSSNNKVTNSITFDKNDTGGGVPLTSISFDDSTATKMNYMKADLEAAINKTAPGTFNQSVAAEAMRRVAQENLHNRKWKAYGDVVSVGTYDNVQDDPIFQSNLLSKYNEVEAERKNKTNNKPELDIPDLPNRRSGADLKLEAEAAARARFRELFPNVDVKNTNKIEQAVSNSTAPSTTITAVAPSNINSVKPPSLEELEEESQWQQRMLAPDSNRTLLKEMEATKPVIQYIATPESKFGLIADKLAQRGVFAPPQTKEVVVGDDGVPRFTGNMVTSTPADSLSDKIMYDVDRLPMVMGAAGLVKGASEVIPRAVSFLSKYKYGDNVPKEVIEAAQTKQNRLEQVLKNRDEAAKAAKEAAARAIPISRREVAGPPKPSSTSAAPPTTPKEVFRQYPNALPDVSIPTKIAKLEAQLSGNISKAERQAIEKSINDLKARQLISTKSEKELNETRKILDKKLQERKPTTKKQTDENQ